MGDALTSAQRDTHLLAANSFAAINFIEDIFGCIYSFHEDKVFTSNTDLKVSRYSKLRDCVIATGFPSGTSFSDENLMRTINFIKEFKKVRMLGSASCMLLEVCQGHFDCYFEKDIYLWDVAAGLAILKSAGGHYIILEGSSYWQKTVIASNGSIPLDELQKLALPDK